MMASLSTFSSRFKKVSREAVGTSESSLTLRYEAGYEEKSVWSCVLLLYAPAFPGAEFVVTLVTGVVCWIPG